MPAPHPQAVFCALRPDMSRRRCRRTCCLRHSSTMTRFYEVEQVPPNIKATHFRPDVARDRFGPTATKLCACRSRTAAARFLPNFVTGYWVIRPETAPSWGRPTALAVANDGALLIADDTAADLRIAYSGPNPRLSLQNTIDNRPKLNDTRSRLIGHRRPKNYVIGFVTVR